MPTYKQTKDDREIKELERKNKQTDEKVIESQQQSNTGIVAMAGEIKHSDYDDTPHEDLIESYVKMVNGCPVISTTLNLIKYPMMGAKLLVRAGSDTDKAKEARDYILWCFDTLYKKERYHRKHKLMALEYGLSMNEKVVKRGDEYKTFKDGKESRKLTNRIIKLAPIQIETITKYNFNKVTELESIEHEKREPEVGDKPIIIEAKDLNWFTFDEKFDDIRGTSILRPVRFYFEAGQKILQAKTNQIIKSSGIVGIHTLGNCSDADKTKIEKIARTIAAVKNGYYVIDKEKAEVILHELKGQQDILGIMQFINRMKFYNTMSQFITAGIGESGSRAATSEHKAPYELALKYILAEYEADYQKLSDEFIKISYLSNIPKEDYPIIEFSTITQADMLKESEIYRNLFQAGLMLTNTDWNIIREHMNLPVSNVKTDTITPPDETHNDDKVIEEKNQMTRLSRNVKPEILEFERNILEFDAVNDYFLSVQEKADKIIEESMKKYFQDIEKQLSSNHKKDINVRHSLMQEMTDKLSKLYEESYSRGESDVKKELGKISKKELQLTGGDKKVIKNSLDKLTKKLYFNIKAAIETNISRLSISQLETMGGINKYLLQFETGFKSDKRDLRKEVQTSYVEGRGDTLLDYKDKISMYLYTSIFDKNLCEECSKFDGNVYTEDELQQLGLGIGSTPNPYCLGWQGGNACRCLLMAYSLK